MEERENSPLEGLSSHPELTFSDLRPNKEGQFEQLTRDVELHFTYDGRGALYQLFLGLRRGGRKSVLLPAFHCPTVVEPALRAGFDVRFYRINDDLTVDVEDVYRCLDAEVAAVLFVNYFGFPAEIEDMKSACKENATYVIEDCAHSFLNAGPTSLSGERGDFAIFSFKKLVPTLVGGAIRCNQNDFELSERLQPIPASTSIVNSKQMIGQAIDQSDSSILKGFQRVVGSSYRMLKRRGKTPDSEVVRPMDDVGGDYEFEMRLANSSIPRFASYVLRSARLDDVVNARQKNYEYMHRQLQSVSHLKTLIERSVDSVCPWAIPVTIDNRSTIDRKLKQKGVPLFTFGETLHPELFKNSAASSETIRSARFLASSLLCFSIHQNIAAENLEPIIQKISDVMI